MPQPSCATQRQADAAFLTLEIMQALAQIADNRPYLPDTAHAPPFDVAFCRRAQRALLMLAAESQVRAEAAHG